MSETNPINPEEHEVQLLEKINTTLADVGSHVRWKRAPEVLPEYIHLKNKNVVMVDDTFMVLENLLPELVCATDGNAKAIHYTGQGLQELVSTILSTHPDVVILDYHLSEELKGVEVIKELERAGFAGKIVGCSSESEKGKEFITAGAVGNIDKSSYPTSDAIKKLATLVG